MPNGRLATVAVSATRRLSRTADHSAGVSNQSLMGSPVTGPALRGGQAGETVLLEHLGRTGRLQELVEPASHGMVLTGLKQHEGVADGVVGGRAELVDLSDLSRDFRVGGVDDAGLRLPALDVGQGDTDVLPGDD